MEVHDHREVLSGGGLPGSVEAETEVAGGIDGGVGGGDALDGFLIGRGFEVNEAEEAAVDGTVAVERDVGHGGDNREDQPEPQRYLRRLADFTAGHFNLCNVGRK